MTRLGFVVIGMLLLHRAAHADSARHVLLWTRAPAADACIDAPTLMAAVDARLGRSVFTEQKDAAIVIEAHVRPIERGWHVAISVRGSDGTLTGQRELEEPAADCRALDDALVLVLALIVDPDAAMRDSPPPPPPSLPPPPPAPVLAPVSPPTPAAPWRFEASVSLIGGGLVIPGPSVGGALRVIVDPPRVPPIGLRGTFWREGDERDDARGVHVRLLTVGLAVCPAVWRLALCGGIEVGRMAGTGFGFDRSQQSVAIVTYATIEPRLAVPLSSRFTLVGAIGAWIPLVRPRFVFEQAGTAMLQYQPPPVAVVGHVGLAMLF
ncbi:MAG: hypothetical protein H0T65_09060 [Deltaproteobacteria bacterium]|nr:hypothetical protein [Deltaproteobacteria bacterium]